MWFNIYQMIAMKNPSKTTNVTKAKAAAEELPNTRSVKVSDPIHYRLRIMAAHKRLRLQDYIDTLLTTGLEIDERKLERRNAKAA